MAHFSLLVLLCLVGHNVNLLTATVLNDVCGNLCAYNVGSSGLEACAVLKCENLIEGNLITLDDVALCDLVLLSAGFNNCEHEKHLSFIYNSLIRVSECFFDPTLCGNI